MTSLPEQPQQPLKELTGNACTGLKSEDDWRRDCAEAGVPYIPVGAPPTRMS